MYQQLSIAGARDSHINLFHVFVDAVLRKTATYVFLHNS